MCSAASGNGDTTGERKRTSATLVSLLILFYVTPVVLCYLSFLPNVKRKYICYDFSKFLSSTACWINNTRLVKS